MNIDSKIYIAGHRGMVGSALMRKLQSQGYSSIITRSHDELDLTYQSDVEVFFQREKPEYVFLAAAKVGGILANSTFKADFIYKNIMIAANVIHASYMHGVKKLLNLGTSCIYPKFASQPLKEEYLLTDYLEPTNEPYAIAKIAAIKLCRYYNEQYSTNFISAMPTNLYGPNDNFNLETSHVLPALIRKFHLASLIQLNDFEGIKKDFKKHGINSRKDVDDLTERDITELCLNQGINKQNITLWGSGSPYREFMYSTDLADACIFLMEQFNSEEIGEIINIGISEDIQIESLAYAIKNLVQYSGEVKWDTSKPDGTPRKKLDVSKISKLGWKAKIKLEEGIRNTYNWYCHE